MLAFFKGAAVVVLVAVDLRSEFDLDPASIKSHSHDFLNYRFLFTRSRSHQRDVFLEG